MNTFIKHIAGKILIFSLVLTGGFLAGARISRSFWAAVILVVALIVNDFFVLYENVVVQWITDHLPKRKKAAPKKPAKKKTPTKKKKQQKTQTAPPAP